jgi:hypothetical protein
MTSSVFGPGTWSMDYLVTGGWAYAPIGDVYPLEPIWSESHGVTGDTVNVADEQNYYSMVCPYYADIDPYFIVQITEDDLSTEDVVEEGVPAGAVATSAWCWLPWGFHQEHQVLVQQVMSGEAPDEVWTGKFKVTFEKPLRQAIGPNTLAKFAFDFWIEGDLERARLAFGDVVFRR